MTYNYYEAMRSDIENILEDYSYLIDEALENQEDYETVYERLYEQLWIDDGVTGNASGSYTFNAYEAEENLCHNMDLLEEALSEFCGDFAEAIRNGAEYCDVTIRCYLLSQVLPEVFDEDTYNERLEALEEEEEEEEETEE